MWFGFAIGLPRRDGSRDGWRSTPLRPTRRRRPVDRGGGVARRCGRGVGAASAASFDGGGERPRLRGGLHRAPPPREAVVGRLPGPAPPGARAGRTGDVGGRQPFPARGGEVAGRGCLGRPGDRRRAPPRVPRPGRSRRPPPCRPRRTQPHRTGAGSGGDARGRVHRGPRRHHHPRVGARHLGGRRLRRPTGGRGARPIRRARRHPRCLPLAGEPAGAHRVLRRRRRIDP